MKKIFFFSVVAWLFSCTEYEKIEDFPIETPKLVANSIFKEGEPFIFSISRSLSVLDNAQLTHIPDAKVILYRDQIAVDTINGANMDIYYRSQIIPEKDYQYHISVSHPRYDPIFSFHEKLPPPVVITDFQCFLIDSVTIIGGWWGSSGSDTIITSYVLDCSLTIHDQGVTESFYSIGIEKWDSLRYSLSGEKWGRTNSHLLRSDDPAVINNTGVGTSNMLTDRLFLNNDLFTGQQYTFNFTIDDRSWSTTLHREYNLIILAYSRSSYMYARSRNFGMLFLTSPFDEPSSVYSNIKGGYGIFAGIDMEIIPLGR